MMKAKIQCIKILWHPSTTVRAVVTATIRERGKEPTVYVLLSHEERMALRYGLGVAVYNHDRIDGWAPLLRAHAICAETDKVEATDRTGEWLNGEDLWVHTSLAERFVSALETWREANPKKPHCIHAPSWRVLTPVRVLAFAAGSQDRVEGDFIEEEAAP